MIAEAVQKVRAIVELSIALIELLKRGPPIVGPIALARLAADCNIPSDLPCSCSCETFEAMLVNAGDAIALPNESSTQTPNRKRRPPVMGPA